MMAVCLALSAYFSATETAFSSANTTRLRAMAEKGSRNAALACRLLEKYDRLLSTILIGNNIPYPDSIIVNTNEAVIDELKKAGINNCWIKRGDFHAMHKEDVSYVRHAEEAQEVLQEYFYRGISRAVINRHLVGDLIKFYGIHNSPFFFWFYPFDDGHSKYGLEAINGKSKGIDFDIDELKDICHRAAEALDVCIYGGDCIVSPEGKIEIIDFNDWPSFAPCRNEAAPFIAKSVLGIIKDKLKNSDK